MNTFYADINNINQPVLCATLLKNYTYMFPKVTILLEHIKWQVSHWLSQNSNITVAVYATNRSDNIVSEFDSTFPGILQLINCSECADIIQQIQELFTSANSNAAASCLSQYEDILTSMLNAVTTIPAIPMFAFSPSLYTALDQFEALNEDFNRLIHAYLTGNMSGQDLALAASKRLQEMTVEIQNIRDEIKTSVTTGVAAVNATCSVWSGIYTAVVQNMTVIGTCIADSSKLYLTLSNMYIWAQLYLTVVPPYTIVALVPDEYYNM
jgi:hypothetical protein